jgi:nucleotide-binding universal stress UspA family protein
MGEKTNPTKILVPVDGSPASESALRYAISIASSFGSELVGIYVVEQEKVGYWRFIDEHFKKELLRKAKEVLDAAAKTSRDRGLIMKTEILQGSHPYEEILTYIENNTDITTVVMGDHGVGLTDRHMVGTTTERVIRQIAKRGIPVAVTVVPHVEADSPSCKLYAGPLCT